MHGDMRSEFRVDPPRSIPHAEPGEGRSQATMAAATGREATDVDAIAPW